MAAHVVLERFAGEKGRSLRTNIPLALRLLGQCDRRQAQRGGGAIQQCPVAEVFVLMLKAWQGNENSGRQTHLART